MPFLLFSVCKKAWWQEREKAAQKEVQKKMPMSQSFLTEGEEMR